MSPDWPPVISTRPSASIAAAGTAAAVDDHVADRAGERIRRRVVQLGALRPVDIAAGDQHLAVSENDRDRLVPRRHHRPGSAERSRRRVVQVRRRNVLDAVVTADDQHLAARQPDGRRPVANRAHRVRRGREDAGRRIVGFGGVEPCQRVGHAAAAGHEDRAVGEERSGGRRTRRPHAAGQRRGVGRRVVELRLRTAARDEYLAAVEQHGDLSAMTRVSGTRHPSTAGSG